MAARNEPKQEAKVTPIAEAMPKKNGWTLRILVVLLVLTAGGAAAWYVLERPATEAAPEVKLPLFVPLESFTVNLQSEVGDQYLQVEMVLEVTEAAAIDTIKLHMPEIRNRILLLLSGKQASEISTAAGKRQLGSEIIHEVEQPLGPQKVRQKIASVFFTSFIIQ